ncbi:hypothetical protein SAMN04488003_10553 [Loktanella fryxellensis]|uniref:Uncharacterized protein n=1 Tax=Loktanella fryxellensis TaxID=245187 RepID=A0A1H8BHH2_9RHOB|nr:hypothetical protein [Loktanella fryxellensis]SEM82400.1 hypothetical protein SAMN04488003_10553 [Loktanella fryxellensis]
MTHLLHLVLLLMLTACAPIGTQVIVARDDWRGTTVITVPEEEIDRGMGTLPLGGPSLLTARPVIVMDLAQATGPPRAYGVLLNQRRQDGLAPRIDRVTTGGVTLPYTRHDRRPTHCVDGCQRAEVGVATLSEEAFRRAAKTGLPLAVWGLRGRNAGVVPADAFARVLARADAGR